MAGSGLGVQCNFDISNKYVFSPNGKLFQNPNSKILQVGAGIIEYTDYVYGTRSKWNSLCNG